MAGQRTGEFGTFDATAMASAIQGAIDGVMLQRVFNPGEVDLGECSRAMVGAFDPRVRRG